MRRNKKFRSIRQKITTLLLALVLASLLVTGVVSVWSLQSMAKISAENNRELGQTSARDAEEALEAAARERLLVLAQEKAAYIEEKFAQVRAYVNGIAELAAEIYENPGDYPDREIAPPKRESRELAPQLLRSARLEHPTGEQLAELLKLGNVQDLLIQYVKNNPMVSSAYLATQSGWMIQADYIAYSKYTGSGEQPDFYEARERQWYQRAKLSEMWETVYSDVMLDIHQGKDCIVCAKPVYLRGELVAVAGVGSYLDTVQDTVLNTTLGDTGYAFLVDHNGQVTISPRETGETAAKAGDLRQSENLPLAELADEMTFGGSGVKKLTLDGREVYLAYAPLESLDWSFVTVMDVSEVIEPALAMEYRILELTGETFARQEQAVQTTFLYFAGIVALAALIIVPVGMLFAGRLTGALCRLTKDVARIDGVHLEYRTCIETGDEIEDLAHAFQRMTQQLQQYVTSLAAVTAEKERIRTEIQVASRLQADMLPDAKGAFVDRKEFLLYASMTPAKGVGGDFYDFFLVDENHLAIVMADVSGKGIPAALFMVVSRTLIRSRLSAAGRKMKEGALAKAVEAVNESLCGNNKNSMFVTAWIGVLTVSTGELKFVNAGHCPPILVRADGFSTYEEQISGFVLGGMEDSVYCEKKLCLGRGDTLFLYTDGVTEATRGGRELFGEERLLQTVEEVRTALPAQLLERVWTEVESFQGEEQFDDITMLAVKYLGSNCRKKTGEPKIERILDYADFVRDSLCAYAVSQETKVKMNLAFDEIFSNICYYSGAKEITVSVWVEEGENATRKVNLAFEDDGIPYNPLERPDPDVKLPLEEREVGGLGIYLVKNQMDHLEYHYQDGKNKFKLTKED